MLEFIHCARDDASQVPKIDQYVCGRCNAMDPLQDRRPQHCLPMSFAVW